MSATAAAPATINFVKRGHFSPTTHLQQTRELFFKSPSPADIGNKGSSPVHHCDNIQMVIGDHVFPLVQIESVL
jgi:hypothetical protein